jgi:hypothetical protein
VLMNFFWSVPKIAKKKGLLASICTSVRLHGTSRHPVGGNSLNFASENFSESLSRKFDFHQNLTRIIGTLHADRYTFLIISRSVLLRMRNVSDKSCRENQNTHFVFSNFFFSKIVPFMK